MTLRIAEAAGLTDVGRQRHTNEDAFLADDPVFAVADGMGGARAGEVASQVAVESFERERDATAPPERRLDTIARDANKRIYEMAQEDESRAGMGTTLTAVIVGEREITLGHVGDSRLYRLRGGELERLSHDHSLVEEFVRQGRITPEEAEVHPQRSIITRALGPEPDVDVETVTYPASDGDVYMLCSDGLTGMVPDDRVARILRETDDLDQAARRLVDEANAKGGRDNITVVLFRVADDDDAGDARGDAAAVADQRTIVGVRADDVRAAATADARRRESAAPARTPRRRRRRLIPVLVGTLALCAIVAVAVVGARQAFFVGTNDRGVLTLYRGVPYELPGGVRLYSTQYSGSLPAAEVSVSQRAHVLDHRLRSRSDAADLIHQLESGSASSAPAP